MSQQLRIWFLIRSLEIGGAQRQLVVLATGLRARGHLVTVHALRPDDHFASELHDAGVEVVRLARASPTSQLAFVARFIRSARREDVDAVHSYLPGQNVIAAVAGPLLKARVVWGVRVAEVELSHYNRWGRLAYRLERALARAAAAIVVNSEAGRAALGARGYPRERLHVIANGIDTASFTPGSPTDAARRSLRQLWRAGEEDLIVGIVGRLDPVKGHIDFIDAAAQVQRERPNHVRFVVVGDGDESRREALQRHATRRDVRVIFAGAHRQMRTVYRSLDIACVASHYEAFPNVLLESMACGTPCVTTDVGDAARIVGDTGVVVPPREPAELARAIVSLIDAPDRAQRGAAARERCVTLFDRGRLLDQTERLLQLLA